MSHTSEKRWPYIVGVAEEAATKMVNVLLEAESIYQELLELYAFVGNDAQALADQLFFDDWSKRSTQGDQAILAVDFVGGSLDSVTINNGGTGYADGVGYIYSIPGGGGDAAISYDVVAGVVSNAAVESPGTTYGDATDQPLNSFPAAGFIPDTEANADELARATDLIAAGTSLHEIYQAADNVAVSQEDRLVQLRRFT